MRFLIVCLLMLYFQCEGAEPLAKGRINRLMSFSSAEGWQNYYKEKIQETNLREACDQELEQKSPPMSCFEILKFGSSKLRANRASRFLHRACLGLEPTAIQKNGVGRSVDWITIDFDHVPEPCGSHLKKLQEILLYQIEESEPIKAWSSLIN